MDEMEAVGRYLVSYYPDVLTDVEEAANRTLLVRLKTDHSDSVPMQQLLRRRISTDPAVLELLREGEAAFYRAVASRVLRERADDVYVNRCPQCGALARTPRAKQCPKCFFSWRETIP